MRNYFFPPYTTTYSYFVLYVRMYRPSVYVINAAGVDVKRIRGS